MAVQRLRRTNLPHLQSRDASTPQSSVAGRIHIYHEDRPPPTPRKDAKYRKVSRQRSLADSLGLFETGDMYSTAKVYDFYDVNSPQRRDSVLDPPFASYFDPKIEDDSSCLSYFAHESSEALEDTCYSFERSHSTPSPRQSLLPPLPQYFSSSEAPFIGRSLCPPAKQLIPTTSLDERPARKSVFESASKHIITPPRQLEQSRSSPLPAVFHRGRTPSPPFALRSKFTRPIATSFSSVSTCVTATSPDSPMSSFSNSDTLGSPTAASSSPSAPMGNGTTIRSPSESRRRANVIRPETLSSMLHGRSTSLPLETKPTSPHGADFDLGLPCNIETWRHGPTLPTADTVVHASPLDSGRTISVGIPNMSPSILPALEPFQEEPAEISAFDSDTDDEGSSPPGTIIRKMVSRPLLKASRSRADTVPAARGRNVSKGASLPKRVCKRDIKTLNPRLSNASENHDTGHGITTPRMSDSSTASTAVLALSDAGTASSPTPLRKKMSNEESASAESKRASDASKASKWSGSCWKHPAASATVGGNGAAGIRSKRPSGKRFRSWFARVFGRRNTI